MKKLNVGLLVMSSEWGGAQEIVYQLAKYLTKFPVEVSLFHNDELHDYYSDLRGISIYSLGTINRKNKFLTLWSYYKIRRNLNGILRSLSLDLIHLNLEGSLFVSFGLPSKFRLPTTITLHGPETMNYYNRKSLVVYWLLKNVFEKAKLIISSSHWQIQNLEPKHKSKIVVISNGVNTREFKPINVKKESDVILFVGRLVELKGVRGLIEAARELPQYQFWFVGKGPLDELINLPNTKSLGFKTRNELIGLYNKATICCFPSHVDNKPLVGLEALACGKPVIATQLGFSEYIENEKDGLIIEPKNAKQLKAAIVKLMKDPALRQVLSQNARKKALRYDWLELVNQHCALYKKIVAE